MCNGYRKFMIWAQHTSQKFENYLQYNAIQLIQRAIASESLTQFNAFRPHQGAKVTKTTFFL